MAILDIPVFQGARPKLEPHLLKSGEAHNAVNCRIQTGGLESFRGSALVQALAQANATSIARFGQTSYWFEFAGDVDVAEGPVPSDTESTTYFTGDGLPAMTYASIATSGAAPYPSARYTLGIPAPGTGMTAAVSGTPDPNDTNPDSRAYTFTWVSARGEEGPPAPASAIVDVYLGQSVNLSNIPTVPTGSYNVTSKRIYRTSSASGDTAYQFVAEIPAAQTTYSDTIASENLGEVLPSESWYPPPTDMQGLIALENGVLAGFTGKTLCLSYPYMPHAWPPEYQITTNEPIVGIAGIRGGVIISTTGRPEVVLFTDPVAASRIRGDSRRPCVAKRSMVDMGEVAIYASADGLVAVDGSGAAQLITLDVIDPYVWRDMNPSTVRGYRLHNWYVGFYDGVNGQAGFVITAQGTEFGFLDFYADGGFSDPQAGYLYLIIGGNIVQWDADSNTPLTYLWRSGTAIVGHPSNAAAARVYAADYPSTPDNSLVFKLFADDVLVHTEQVASDQPFRLPDAYLARNFQIQLEGTRTVRRVVVAESMSEIT